MKNDEVYYHKKNLSGTITFLVFTYTTIYIKIEAYRRARMGEYT